MSGPTNSYHLRAALMDRFNELARITGQSKTDMVNEAVERYVCDEMMRIAMGRHCDRRPFAAPTTKLRATG